MQGMEYIKIKNDLEKWASNLKEVDIKEWYTQVQVNQIHAANISLLKNHFD